MLPPLLFKLDVPTNMHPRNLDENAHCLILYHRVSDELANGAMFWERPVIDAILGWSVANHAGMEEKCHTESSLIDKTAFDLLYRLLEQDGVLPLSDEFYTAMKWTNELQPGQSKMDWMLGLCRRITMQRNAMILKVSRRYLSQSDPAWAKDDKEVMRAAVLNQWHGLQFASDRLRDDREVVLAAISKNGHALQFASDRLKDNKEVVLAAVSENEFAYWFASERLRDDKVFMLQAVSNNGFTLRIASQRLQDDDDVVRAAVAEFGAGLQYASDRLQDDREIVLVAVAENGLALKHASARLKDEKEVVLVAIDQDKEGIAYASERLQQDPEVQSAVAASQGDGN